jgi:hypothetical protein
MLSIGKEKSLGKDERYTTGLRVIILGKEEEEEEEY